MTIVLSIIGYFFVALATALFSKKMKFFYRSYDEWEEDMLCKLAGMLWPLSLPIGLFFILPYFLFSAGYKWAKEVSLKDSREARKRKKAAQEMSAIIKSRNRINELERSENLPLTTWDVF
jgi:hypothetical protein